jgi:hypothetical protein
MDMNLSDHTAPPLKTASRHLPLGLPGHVQAAMAPPFSVRTVRMALAQPDLPETATLEKKGCRLVGRQLA